MLKNNQQAAIRQTSERISTIYQAYSGMLLGYITEVVKDRTLAEEYLVRIFCALAGQPDRLNRAEGYTWEELRKFARAQLSELMHPLRQLSTGPAPKPAVRGPENKYLEKLSEPQRHVFCGIYYQGKSVAVLSAELNQPEEKIRKTLKEAFLLMRKSGEN